MTRTNQPLYIQPNENVAIVLGALTSVGGVIGYARTGSVPSIVAGLTVGTLVRPLLIPILLDADRSFS